MREDGYTKKSKFSWSKSLVRKWFNIKTKAQDFHADVVYGGGNREWNNSYSEMEACTIKKSRTERLNRKNFDGVRRGKLDLDAAQVTDVQNHSIFVATWNVGGKSPPSHLNLEDWLHTSPPADIYVLGFQEIVPLNAGNVLGAEDNGPARKWLALIRKTLNNLPGTSGNGCCYTPSPVPDPVVELDADFEGSTRQKASSFFHRRSFQSLSHSMRMDNDMLVSQPRLDRRYSVCDRVMFGNRPSDYDPNYRWGSSDEENVPEDSPSTVYSPMSFGGSNSMEHREKSSGNSRYCLISSKQMVGIFLTVWVRSELTDAVRNIKVSCIGRGLMGYLGNKGSISVSMSLHQTSFCFVCSHLTSGQKEGDELRRNSDVMEILRKTRFPRVHGLGDERSPETIMDHDRVIWLGDLNYRIALSYRSAKALDGAKGGYISLQHTSTRITQIDMQGMTPTTRKNGELRHGVIAFCGMEEASGNYLMFVASQGSQITGQFIVSLLPRLNQSIIVKLREVRAAQVLGLRSKNFYLTHVDILSLISSEWLGACKDSNLRGDHNEIVAVWYEENFGRFLFCGTSNTSDNDDMEIPRAGPSICQKRMYNV
ncbi:hypothetical protein C5167_043380 [Papaver somniferum]|uniref:Inositol polyphosphate-related phosphatase domain-containing protein n=1 Tax=Papaver somniferum TaxID=3469 RepID=A0A4Y7L9H3_PAPSO|nr:hypothetical protein C5167_043380 [Papaver somniferum]